MWADKEPTCKTPQLFYAPSKKRTEKEIMDTVPFAVASKKINYLEIYLAKEVKELYNENLKP